MNPLRRRLGSLLLAGTMTLSLCGTAFAVESGAVTEQIQTKQAATSGTCGKNLTWSVDEGTGTLTIRGTGAMTDYSYDDWDTPWRDYNEVIQRADIQSGITSIGSNAFLSCYALTTVTLPKGLTRIGEGAFQYCSNLKSITLPSSLTDIGYGAFFACPSLTSVTIPSGVTSIGNAAFYGCSRLASVTISSGVTSIGEAAFRSCVALTSITIPAGVTSIGDWAFYECSRLVSVKIPPSVVHIGEDAFSECNKNLAFSVKSGSAAEAYARKHSIPYFTWSLKTQNVVTKNQYIRQVGDKAFQLNAITSGDGKLSYKSDNKKVATVSDTGKVTIKGVGKTTITITAAETDRYKKATKKVTVTVNPKGTTLTKLTNPKGKKLKASWKKVSGVSGYEIQYGTSKTFKGAKTEKATASKTSTTISGLKKGKTYYVRIRTYKTVSGKKYCSGWSGSKKLKITK